MRCSIDSPESIRSLFLLYQYLIRRGTERGFFLPKARGENTAEVLLVLREFRMVTAIPTPSNASNREKEAR